MSHFSLLMKENPRNNRFDNLSTISFVLINKDQPYMTVISRIHLLIISLLVLTSCAPQTKEAYMDQYEEFIEEVQKDHKEYTSSDWDRQDEKFRQFSDEWAKKFEEDFTLTEQLVVAKHAITYAVLSAKKETGDLFRAFLQDDDVQELRDQIKYYAENEMEEDIQKVVEEAEGIGEEAVKAVEEILRELDQEIDVKIEINRRDRDNE